MNSDPLERLQTIFGFTSFRPLQAEIIQSVLRGEDVFVLMPTGGGKSLCYQLPALMQDGLTVVVSPLIALMKDQVDALQKRGVDVTYINSSLDTAEVGRRQAALARREFKLAYVAPERLMMPGFLGLLASIRPERFVIDEAHCISEWGHDFRPDYRALKRLRELFPSSAFSALTATATRRVQADIKDQLGMQGAASFQASFNRPNLIYAVWPKRDAYRRLLGFLRAHGRAAGIIYCLSRAGTEELAARLQADRFKAIAYHAGLGSEERQRRQDAFAHGDVDIIVATIAFGMGIDKADVRFVIHYDLPRNLEGYYQESGRAGRDGQPSDCILFYSGADAVKHRYFIDQKQPAREREIALQQLRQMEAWATSASCRRRALLAYFGERFDEQASPCCDRCRAPLNTIDSTDEARLLLACVKETGERFGLAYVLRVLVGSGDQRIGQMGHEKLKSFGAGRRLPRAEWRRLAEELLLSDYILQAREEFNVVRLTARGRAVLAQGDRVQVTAPEKPELVSATTDAQLNEPLFEQLRALRKGLASERNVSAFVIFYDSTLRQIAADLPTTREDLLRMSGVGARKADDFGELFLACVRDYVQQTGAQPLTLQPVPQPPRIPSKGPAVLESVMLFRAGKSVQEIAAARDRAPSTIMGQLEAAIAAGEALDLDRLVGAEKRRVIECAIAEFGSSLLKPIKERLGDDCSYDEIRIVRAAWVRDHVSTQANETM